MTFQERLEARKNAEVPTREVQLAFDDDLVARREFLEAQLQAVRAATAADERLARVDDEEAELQRQLDELLEASRDALVTFRFRQLKALAWGELTARCPMRIGAAIDEHYGYNVQAVAVLAAPQCGVRIEDGEEVEVSEEEWRDLFAVISGHEFTLIVDAIFDLNEFQPAAQLGALKKGLAALQSSEQS